MWLSLGSFLNFKFPDTSLHFCMPENKDLSYVPFAKYSNDVTYFYSSLKIFLQVQAPKMLPQPTGKLNMDCNNEKDYLTFYWVKYLWLSMILGFLLSNTQSIIISF